MDTLLNDGEGLTFISYPAQYFREEIFISASDAFRLGIARTGEFAILSVEPLLPGPPNQEFAVRIAVRDDMEPGGLRINQVFADSLDLQLGYGQPWSIKRAQNIVPIKEAVIEPVTDFTDLRREIQLLQKNRQNIFFNRCILFKEGSNINSLSLPVSGKAYFNLRSIQPPLNLLRPNTLLTFEENTVLKVFVPHSKGAVDMVIVVDASGSMDIEDYVNANNVARSRLEGVRYALDTLFQRRLVSGSRVSRIAAIVFGNDARMLYPTDVSMTELKSEAQIEEIRRCIHNLSKIGLERLRVDRTHTSISVALRYAAELLDYYSQEGNEKLLVLLSDGADWQEDTDNKSEGEIISTLSDPLVLAENLNFDSQIRIHTVAISDKQAFERYGAHRYQQAGYAIPNTQLLSKIAVTTNGVFFENPDAQVLNRLFEDIGQGTTYLI